MKIKIFAAPISLIIAILLSCTGTGGEGDKYPATTPIVTGSNTPVPEVVDPDPGVTTGMVQAVFFTPEGAKFYDGEQMWLWRDGASEKAAPSIYANANVLYKLDEYGAISQGRNLVTQPNFIRIEKGQGAEFDLNGDVWIVETVPRSEVEAAIMPKLNYTRVYFNAVEHGDWRTRDYLVDGVAVIGSDIFICKPGTGWAHLNGSKNKITCVVPDGEAAGFVMWGADYNTRKMYFNDIQVNFGSNFQVGATEWLLGSDGIWYSKNGYTWDGLTCSLADAAAMWEYRTVQNMIIAAGVRFENGENVMYWIQCATGWVIRFVPSINQARETVRLFEGSGDVEAGALRKKYLKPAIIGDYLYFNVDDNMYRYDFETGLNSFFGSDIDEVVEY